MKFKKIILSVLAFFFVLCAFGCGEKSPEEEKQELLEQIMSGVVVDSSYKNLANDLVLPEIAGGQYLITWTIAEEYSDYASIEVLDDGTQKIVITQVEGKANAFKLVGTINDGAVTVSRTWDGYVKAAKAADPVTCLAVKESAVNEYLQVTGVVTYVYTNVGFWVEDETGSLYIYVNGAFEAALGDTVTVKGSKAIHYSLHQLKTPTITVVENGTIDYASKAPAATIAEMAKFAKDYYGTTATDAEKTAIAFKYGALYTLTGKLLANTDTNISYKYILKDEITGEFINLYDSPMSTEVKAQLETLVGKYVTGTFMFWDTHSGGYGRFLPVATLTETQAPTATDAQKVESAKKEIAALLADTIVADVDLFTTSGLGATVVWTSSNEAFLTSAGKIGASTNATETVTLTAVITAGNETAEVETEVTVKFPEPITVKAVVDACGTDAVVCFKGKVIATDVDGYLYVADSTAVIYVRTKLAEVEGLAVGDFVKIVGTATVYNNSGKQYTRQVKTISITEITEEVTVMAAKQVTIADFPAIQATEGIVAEESITAYKANENAYSIVTFEAYVTIRTSYNNVWFATANDTTSSALLYYYKSFDQDGVKALEGKLVTVTCVIYDIGGADGWRLGSVLEIAEKTA